LQVIGNVVSIKILIGNIIINYKPIKTSELQNCRKCEYDTNFEHRDIPDLTIFIQHPITYNTLSYKNNSEDRIKGL